jgi:hypothetical protein
MKIALENLGLSLEITGDMRATYEGFNKPMTDREYKENAIEDLTMRLVTSVLINVLTDIGQNNIEDPSDYAYRAMLDIANITPERIAQHMGHVHYGKSVN